MKQIRRRSVLLFVEWVELISDYLIVKLQWINLESL